MLCTLVSALALAAPQAAIPAPPPVDPSGFGVDLDLHGAELLDYAWDGGPPVPFLRSDPAVHLGYGERGAGPRTRLYLPGNALLEAGATGARVIASVAVDSADGRLGNGYRFGSGSRVVVQLPPASPGSYGWSLSFWIRPDAGAVGRTFLALGDAAEIVLASDRRLRVDLVEPADGSLTSAVALELGRWTRVALSYDPTLLYQMRLHVGGTSVARTLTAGTPPRVPVTLVAGDVRGNGSGLVGLLDELRLEDEPVTTQRALEEAETQPRPGPHPLVARTTAGEVRFAPWASPQRDPVLDSTDELARGVLDGAAVLGGSLRWVPARWERLATDGAPPPRTTHPMADLGHGRVLVFGGETRDTHLWAGRNTDDTWILDAATRSWRRVAMDHAPAPRCHVPAAYSPDHDLVLLVGGWRFEPESEVYSDTWVFQPSQERWEERHPSGVAIGQRSDHVLVYHPVARRFLLMQGNRVLLYDPVADAWESKPAPAVVDESGAPAQYSLAGSTAAVFDPGTGAVVLFGGEFSASQPFTYRDTTVLYDLASNRFTVLGPPVHPEARARTAFARDPVSGWLVLFGGVGDQHSQRFDDLWAFDPVGRGWIRLEASNAPIARGGYYGFAYDDVRQCFLLPMGRHSFERWLDETLALTVAPSRRGTAGYCFDRAGFGGSTRWVADVDTPGDSSVSFAFRTSSSGLCWSPWTTRATGFARVRFVQVLVTLQPGSNREIPSVRRMGFE